MTIENAIRILDPETTVQAMQEIEYYSGFSGKKAALSAMQEAHILACDIMRKYLEEHGND